jgi:short-subunit dehydrogenase
MLAVMALPAADARSTALVTGASSGLGVELARSLANRGHGVTLVARRADRIEHLADELAKETGVQAQALACDLRAPDARTKLVEDIAALGLTVEVLVNNAGYGSGGRFVELDPRTEVAMVRLNCEAVIDLCATYAPAMVARRRGAILNVASTVSFQPVVRQATYSASKAMVRTFTEALHEELRDYGVAVAALCPGPMRTEFIEVAAVQAAADSAPDFMFDALPDVAELGMRALEDNRRVVVPGIANRVGAVAGAHTPHGLLLRAMNRFYPIGR